MNEHPTYPIRHGVPAMDRCICGGVRHWHALAPNGCDDCDCEEFALDESWRAPVEPPVLSRAANPILAELQAERDRQDAKFPDQHLPNGTLDNQQQRDWESTARFIVDLNVSKGKLTWADVLREEYHEVMAEEDKAALRNELIQVAAVAVRWIEDLDRRDAILESLSPKENE